MIEKFFWNFFLLMTIVWLSPEMLILFFFLNSISNDSSICEWTFEEISCKKFFSEFSPFNTHKHHHHRILSKLLEYTSQGQLKFSIISCYKCETNKQTTTTRLTNLIDSFPTTKKISLIRFLQLQTYYQMKNGIN